ncbi:hypothetical protein OTK49_21395 [Vibrio coralliirubri]|uniref:hypothetical protein n=1 Tax=Vibrio coralliirubri TaxID=1516159 RepID=UPI002283C568|nr:hypothetical protein [Vibrio coralliirubri]MCY9865077.1 hypothetical protein [Vibrio coralliirubri]
MNAVTKQRIFDLSKQAGLSEAMSFTGVVADIKHTIKLDRANMYLLTEQLKAHLEASPILPQFSLFGTENDFDIFRIGGTVESNEYVTQQLFINNENAYELDLTTLKNGSTIEITGHASVLRQDHFAGKQIKVVEEAVATPSESTCRLVNFLLNRNESSDLLFALVARNAAKNKAIAVTRTENFTNSNEHHDDALVAVTYAKTIAEAMARLDTDSSLNAFVADCLLDEHQHFTGSEFNTLAGLELHVIDANTITPWGCITTHLENNLG